MGPDWGPAPYALYVRKTFCVILLVLAAVLSIPAVALIWLQRNVVDVNRFTATSEAIIAQPEVQTDIANRVTDAVMQQLHVPELIDNAAGELPPRLGDALHKVEPALDGAVGDYVNRAATAVVGSEQFLTVWSKVNRLAHQAVMKLLQGQGDSVVLDLGPVVQEVKTRLVNRGFELAANIPDLHPQYTLVSSPKIARARNWYSAYEVLRWLLPLLALACWAGGVALARDRWRALMWGAIGIGLAMALTGIVTWIVADRLHQGEAVYNAFAVSLRSMLRWVFLACVVVAAVAYLMAYRIRHRIPLAGAGSGGGS